MRGIPIHWFYGSGGGKFEHLLGEYILLCKCITLYILAYKDDNDITNYIFMLTKACLCNKHVYLYLSTVNAVIFSNIFDNHNFLDWHKIKISHLQPKLQEKMIQFACIFRFSQQKHNYVVYAQWKMCLWDASNQHNKCWQEKNYNNKVQCSS